MQTFIARTPPRPPELPRLRRYGRHLLSFRSLMEGQWNRYGDRVDLKPPERSSSPRARNDIRS
jgi:hypothetical protein